MNKIPSLLTLLAALAAVAFAEPVTLTRSEAFELHDALTKLSPGLSPDNTFTVADNINALDVTAKAYRTAVGKVIQAQQVAQVAQTPESLAKFKEEDAKLATAAEERRAYELTPFVLTKDEVKAANISALQLATIKRLLKPDPKPNPAK